MKRPPTDVSRANKRPKIEEIHILKRFIIRNDTDPHVLVNIKCDYVKIGDFIYKTKPFDSSWERDCIISVGDMVGLTAHQYKNVSKYVTHKNILVSSFHLEVLPISKLDISLSTDSTFKIYTRCDDLLDYILDLLEDHIVCYDQIISIEYLGMLINVNIDLLDDKMAIGKIDRDTEIEINFFDDNIVITNDSIEVDSKTVKVYITKCVDVNSFISKFPVIFDQSDLDKFVRSTFDESFIDNEEKIYLHDNLEFTFNIQIMNGNKQIKYKNTYELKNDNKLINIQSNTKNLIVTEGKEIAEKVCFTIDAFAHTTYDAQDYIIFVGDIIKHVKENIKYITTNQSFKLLIKIKKEISLKVSYVNPYSNSILMYKIDPEKTKITFDTKTKSKFILVKNSKPLAIEKIVFKVKKESLGGFLSMLMGSDDKPQIFDSKKLGKIVKKLFPKKTAIKHQMKITYDNSNYVVVVKDLIFNEKDKNNLDEKFLDNINFDKYAIQGLITDKTEFKFEISRNDKTLTINDPEKSEAVNKPMEELEKHVGGISTEIKKVIRTICLSRGKLKEEFLARGLKPARGIIFYGPPGTGKTSLARNLGKILGCEGDRFKLMSGPEVFNKYVGQSEANVRAIFKPAKEAWKKLKHDAPTYMIVIDEIDAMIPSRSGSSGNPVRDSVVNQFLAEMDGLEQFHNLICIGITNRLELIDPAATRAGRFGVHIKIDLPDKKGRLAIFNIHTKKLKDINRMGNIDFDKLVNLTDKFSGADIESVVELASTYSLDRLNDLDVMDKKIIETTGKITQDDLVKAIKEINSSNKKTDDSNKNHHMYT